MTESVLGFQFSVLCGATENWELVSQLMYVELHSRSAFSFLEGAAIPEELIAVCANFGMPAMALLDRDGVYGAPRFHLAAQKAGVKAHIGAEVTCAPFSPYLRDGFRLPILAASRA